MDTNILLNKITQHLIIGKFSLFTEFSLGKRSGLNS